MAANRSISLRYIVDALDRSMARIEFSLDATILDANENFLKLMGYTLDEVRGRPHSMFVDEATQASDEYREFWARLRSGEFQSGEFRRITKTGEPVWFNHAAVFHTSLGDGELRRVFQLRPTARSFLGALAGKVYTKAQRLRDPDKLPLHCTYGDGTPIPDSDMEAVRDAIWKHQVITPWKRGDVVAIDNDSTAHGRMPFYGPRMIAVAWA
jgi:PAS domain S-box-containing protein